MDFGGTYVLAETADGSELRLSSVCTVKVPLIGGKIEQLGARRTARICSTPSAISPATGSPVITRPTRPVGVPTRGTTNANRLRRADRWVLNSPRVRAAIESATDPVVVDLGYGRLPVTTLELAARLRTVRPDIRVVGLEIDPERVVPGVAGVEFAVGGFELAGLHPILVRAFNVLRQYPEDSVAEAWDTMRAGLAPGRADPRRDLRRTRAAVLLGAARR